jgi:hypothetical protein
VLLELFFSLSSIRLPKSSFKLIFLATKASASSSSSPHMLQKHGKTFPSSLPLFALQIIINMKLSELSIAASGTNFDAVFSREGFLHAFKVF